MCLSFYHLGSVSVIIISPVDVSRFFPNKSEQLMKISVFCLNLGSCGLMVRKLDLQAEGRKDSQYWKKIQVLGVNERRSQVWDTIMLFSLSN